MLRIDVLLEHLARAEGNHTTRRNPDFLTGSRIPPFPRALAPDDEVSKTSNLDRFPLLQYSFEHIQYELDNISRFIFRDTDLLVNLVCNISLSHASPLRNSLKPVGHLNRDESRFRHKLREVMGAVKRKFCESLIRQSVSGEQFIFNAVGESLPTGLHDIFGDADCTPFVFVVS